MCFLAAFLYRIATGKDPILAGEVQCWRICEYALGRFCVECTLHQLSTELHGLRGLTSHPQAVVALIVISKLGKVFSVLTWAYLTVLVAFIAPKLYELKKPEIDDALATGHARTKQLYDQHVAPQSAHQFRCFLLPIVSVQQRLCHLASSSVGAQDLRAIVYLLNLLNEQCSGQDSARFLCDTSPRPPPRLRHRWQQRREAGLSREASR